MDEWIEGLEGGRARLLNGWVGSWLAGWNPGRKKKGWIYGGKESKMDESESVAVNSWRAGWVARRTDGCD